MPSSFCLPFLLFSISFFFTFCLAFDSFLSPPPLFFLLTFTFETFLDLLKVVKNRVSQKSFRLVDLEPSTTLELFFLWIFCGVGLITISDQKWYCNHHFTKQRPFDILFCTVLNKMNWAGNFAIPFIGNICCIFWPAVGCWLCTPNAGRNMLFQLFCAKKLKIGR